MIIELEKYNDLLQSIDKSNRIIGWTMLMSEFRKNRDKIDLQELCYLKIVISSRAYEPLFIIKKRNVSFSVSRDQNLCDDLEKIIFLRMIEKKLKYYSTTQQAKAMRDNQSKILELWKQK